MMNEYFQRLVKKKSFSKAVYPTNFIERRTQEEIVRSDEQNDNLIYAEIDFNAISNALQTDEDRKKFIDILFETLQNDIRASDAIGMLPNDSGIVVLMPEALVDGWIRLQHIFEQRAHENTRLSKVFKELVKPIIYPQCLNGQKK